MNIVLSEMYTESLNENYIFCVKSIIQVVNKSEQIILLLCPAFGVVSDLSHSGWPGLCEHLQLSHQEKMYHAPRGFLSGGLWDD